LQEGHPFHLIWASVSFQGTTMLLQPLSYIIHFFCLWQAIAYEKLFLDSPCITNLITISHLLRIDIRRFASCPFTTRMLKIYHTTFMEKSRQRAIIDDFSLKGRVSERSRRNLQIHLVRMDIHKPRSRGGLLASVQATFPVSMKLEPEDRS
jgi:hypothetical protein